jgi:hypothetical protein
MDSKWISNTTSNADRNHSSILSSQEEFWSWLYRAWSSFTASSAVASDHTAFLNNIFIIEQQWRGKSNNFNLSFWHSRVTLSSNWVQDSATPATCLHQSPYRTSGRWFGHPNTESPYSSLFRWYRYKKIEKSNPDATLGEGAYGNCSHLTSIMIIGPITKTHCT